MYKSIIFSIVLCCCGAEAAMAQSMKPDFTEKVIDQISIGYGLAIGDVNGDSRPDILLADKKQIVWYRNGDWKRFVMVDSLTEYDNVCIAAEDINQDGQVEVAIGAQWNPGETFDASKSGSVHYLIRPDNPEEKWKPVALHHEPTVHRMRWFKNPDGRYALIVLPLHGRENQNGEGKGVKVIAYHPPQDMQSGNWDTVTIDRSMHLTHNLAVKDQQKDTAALYIAGKEGVVKYQQLQGTWQRNPLPALNQGAGELAMGQLRADQQQFFMTTIEPMHGNQLVLYQGEDFSNRTILYDNMKEGHALACADVLGLGRDQIVVGWRNPNSEGKVGIKIFIPVDEEGDGWMHYYLDDNGMACEDLKIADLDQDGDLDIVAAGRATANLKIYWNQLADKKPKAN